MLFFALCVKNLYFKLALLLSFTHAASEVVHRTTFHTLDYCSLLYCVYDPNPLPVSHNLRENCRQSIIIKITLKHNIIIIIIIIINIIGVSLA
jgi:hypothetical protein